jgi:hypothetical protein
MSKSDSCHLRFSPASPLAVTVADAVAGLAELDALVDVALGKKDDVCPLVCASGARLGDPGACFAMVMPCTFKSEERGAYGYATGSLASLL